MKQEFIDPKLELTIEKQSIVNFLQNNEEKEFPKFKEEIAVEFSIINVEILLLLVKIFKKSQKPSNSLLKNAFLMKRRTILILSSSRETTKRICP